MWQPINLPDLQELLENELQACSPTQQEFFEAARLPPAKWQLSPWGDQGGGFWVVAVHGDRALWYNDIEAGFNVSHLKCVATFLRTSTGATRIPSGRRYLVSKMSLASGSAHPTRCGASDGRLIRFAPDERAMQAAGSISLHFARS